ncbi:hypothetical protein GCM10027429_15520 [Marivirga atlantica]|jgi:hypothetical protein|uniref:Outer membrane protein beta-barrel domain-containing protein n=1 Tax=Marivirga atlantica TaxID=1548457 RepID=A0A937DIN6_9BACT|nr:DUF6588 family protein [Marivirga atlantica]MBL0765170.1 hypothetical protein [Marivirga atlantica]
MKQSYKYLLGLALASLLMLNSLNAQNFEEVINSSSQDANTYLKNYMNPFAGSLGNGLANGWYNTARPHKTLGFDLTTTVSLAAIPDSEKMFEFIGADYNNIDLVNETTGASLSGEMLPTFAGGEYSGEGVLEVSGSRELAGGVTVNDTQQFGVPDGLGLDEFPGPLAVPVPSVQLGIGIVKKTELVIRFTPEINVDDVSFKQFGFGIKHDVKQWIPGMKLLPFDLSGFFGFNKITSEYYIDQEKGQYAEFTSSATTVQAIISKKLLFFTPYAGLGFNIVNSSFNVLGDYTFDDGTGGEVTVTDPVGIDFDGSGGPRFTIGARLKILWVLSLHADYTFQKYNTTTVGFGINIR